MSWYIAKIIFRISSGEITIGGTSFPSLRNTSKSQFDEHLRLIEADNFEEAFLKTRVLGLQEEASFLNDNQEQVKWEFVNVAELLPIKELKDGQELYSQIHELEDAGPYIHFVHQRAAAMQLKHRPVF
jgi:Domain of unknown function (DUF4288)